MRTDTQRAALVVDAAIRMRLMGDAQGARTLFERALQMDPANARARDLLATMREAPRAAPRAPTKGVQRFSLGPDFDDVAPAVKADALPARVAPSAPRFTVVERPAAPAPVAAAAIPAAVASPVAVASPAARPPPPPRAPVVAPVVPASAARAPAASSAARSGASSARPPPLPSHSVGLPATPRTPLATKAPAPAKALSTPMAPPHPKAPAPTKALSPMTATPHTATLPRPLQPALDAAPSLPPPAFPSPARTVPARAEAERQGASRRTTSGVLSLGELELGSRPIVSQSVLAPFESSPEREEPVSYAELIPLHLPAESRRLAPGASVWESVVLLPAPFWSELSERLKELTPPPAPALRRPARFERPSSAQQPLLTARPASVRATFGLAAS